MTAITSTLSGFSRNANAAPPRHRGTRYSTDGVFLPEPGNTVVSHVVAGSRSQSALLKVRDRFMAMPEAGQFAFTAASSLHMTIFQGIIEHRRNLPYWPSDVPLDTPIDAMTEHYRKRLAVFPSQGSFRARITGLTPLGVVLEGDTETDRVCLRRWRDSFANVFGYRHPDHDDYAFHITFAYIVDWLAEDTLGRWEAMLEEQLAYLQRETPVVELDPPAFCSFEDMHHFEELLVFVPLEEKGSQ